jgi:ABC-2 type transport system ATP-binding protein
MTSAPAPALPADHAAVTDPPAIDIVGLSHRYPKAEALALDDVALRVQPGELFALLGPNGGGKTTTFRTLATLLQPTDPQAAVRVFGHDVRTDPAAARRALGVVFQSPSLDPKLTARENLQVQARLYGLRRRDAAPRIEAALETFDLADRAGERVENFSGGMRRRLEIGKALLHRPRLLLMDEPATGLDPAARRTMWEHLEQLRRRDGLTVFWTTHQMDEAERADRIAVIAAGRVRAVTTPGELKARIGGHVVTAEPLNPEALEALRDRIEQTFGPWSAGPGPILADAAVRFEHPDGPAVVARVADLMPGGLRRLSVGTPTLEDAYLQLIAETS